jgi:hypothetical protein
VQGGQGRWIQSSGVGTDWPAAAQLTRVNGMAANTCRRQQQRQQLQGPGCLPAPGAEHHRLCLGVCRPHRRQLSQQRRHLRQAAGGQGGL